MTSRVEARRPADVRRTKQAATARKSLAPHQWPYGPRDHRETCCVLHDGADYCDCKASDESDTEYGASHAGTGS